MHSRRAAIAPPRALLTFCLDGGFSYRARERNLAISGLLFRRRAHLLMEDIAFSAHVTHPFLLARIRRGRRQSREIKVIVIPLARPVPNIVLLSTTGGVVQQAGIALKESQHLQVEGDFQRSFRLYCPTGYERDALYVFAPDLLARLMDSAAGCDVELVDDRAIIYASSSAFTTRQQLDAIPPLVQFLLEKLRRQTQRYADERSTAHERADPFRQAQVRSTSSHDGQYIVGTAGRRLRLRTTARQKVVIALGAALMLAAGVYWLGMNVLAFLLPGS